MESGWGKVAQLVVLSGLLGAAQPHRPAWRCMMMPWRRHRCCQGDPELAQLPPDPSQDACLCPGCVVAISRALCLRKGASLTHGELESQGLGWAPAHPFPQCVALQKPLGVCWLPPAFSL